MHIKIQLADNNNLTVKLIDTSYRHFSKAFKKALRSGKMLEVISEDGRILAINPYQIQYLEFIPENHPDHDQEIKDDFRRWRALIALEGIKYDPTPLGGTPFGA